MSANVLQAETRELNLTRGELNKKRKAGTVPGVVFGKEIESIPVFVDLITFKRVYASQGKIFELKVGSTTHMVNTKEIEMNVLGNQVNHINFHKLKAGQSTTINIPVVLTGESKGAKNGGLVTTNLDVLPVTGLPKDMPENLEIDITELDLGETINVSDVKLTGKFTIDIDADTTVVSCAAAKVQEEEPAAEAVADGEAAPAEGGDTPPAEAAPAEAKKEE